MNPVIMMKGHHLFPCRTQKLSPSMQTIVRRRRLVKICHCRVLYSSLAQSVEHSAVNRVVVGSSPTGGAIMSGQKPNCRKTSILSGFFVFFGANFKLKFRRPIFGESLYLADSNRGGICKAYIKYESWQPTFDSIDALMQKLVES